MVTDSWRAQKPDDVPPTLNIHLDIDESIATLTIDRPEVKNALNRETVDECLRGALGAGRRATTPAYSSSPGAGESSLCRARISATSGRALATRVWRQSPRRSARPSSGFRVRRSPPSTATRSAAAASWRWRATSAWPPKPRSSGSPSSAWASSPPPAARSVCRASSGSVGRSTSILTGEIVDAKQALAIGLVTAVTPAGQLQLRARELAKKILRQGPLAARLAKLALNASARVDLDSGLLIETLAQAICYELGGQAGRDDRVPGEAEAEVHGR